MIKLYLFFFTFAIAQTSAALTVKSSEWRHHLERVMPKLLCESESYFSKCFSTAEHICQKEVSQAMQGCWQGITVGKTLNPEAEGVIAASKWGNCIGRKFEKNQLNQKRDDKTCEQLSRWM